MEYHIFCLDITNNGLLVHLYYSRLTIYMWKFDVWSNERKYCMSRVASFFRVKYFIMDNNQQSPKSLRHNNRKRHLLCNGLFLYFRQQWFSNIRSLLLKLLTTQLNGHCMNTKEKYMFMQKDVCLMSPRNMLCLMSPRK